MMQMESIEIESASEKNDEVVAVVGGRVRMQIGWMIAQRKDEEDADNKKVRVV
jgi:hypothetical protein